MRQLRVILTTKLVMDDRRPSTFHQTRIHKKDKPIKMATLATMFMSALMGIAMLMSFLIGNDPTTHLTFYFSFFFFFLSLTLIADFTSVLIDVRDNFIILPRPVSDRTFLVARLLHIFIHLGKIQLAMVLPGFITMLWLYGIWGTLLFLLMVFFVAQFSILFINAVYLVILRITTPAKFQSVISYVQIVFAIAMYGSFQLLPRMMNQLWLQELTVSSKDGIISYPLYWFASAWKVLFSMKGTSMEILAAALAFILPFASIFIIVKYLAPSFNNKLVLINSSGAGLTKKTLRQAAGTKGKTYAEFLSRLATTGNAERAGFLFSWKMSSRSREFKMKVYPAIGYLIVLGVILFINSKELTIADVAEQKSAGKLVVLFALYFTSFLLTMAVSHITYSDKYRASWIFYTSPLKKPGEVILGGIKAAIFKFYIPLVIVVAAAGLGIIGAKVLPNIALGFFNVLLITMVVVYAGNKLFPFSIQMSSSVNAGGFYRNLFVLLVLGMLAFGHYLVYDFTLIILIFAALSVIANLLLMHRVRNTSWQSIGRSYYEEG